MPVVIRADEPTVAVVVLAWLLPAEALLSEAPPATRPTEEFDAFEFCNVELLATINSAPATLRTVDDATLELTVALLVASASLPTRAIRPPTEPVALAVTDCPDDGRLLETPPGRIAVAIAARALRLPAGGRLRCEMMLRLPAVMDPATPADTFGVTVTSASDSPIARVPAVTPAA